MPELPEVETIRRELEPLLPGKTFARPVLHMPTTIGHPSPELFAAGLEGQGVEKVRRRGKYLIINLNRGIMVVHLRMTGNLIYSASGSLDDDRFLRVTMPFCDGSALFFLDMRRFGRLWFLRDEEEMNRIVLRNVGPDYYTEISRGDFVEKLGQKERSRLKALLLDQGFAAGMGNIYTDECLFRCSLHPETRVSTLCREKRGELYDAIQEVLKQGIEHGGTSFRDYRSASGALGDFQSRLKVYGRKDENCRCGGTICKTTVAGRGTYYCSCCQAVSEEGEEDEVK